MNADSFSKARELLIELLEPGAGSPGEFHKILLLGIREARDYHRDFLSEGGKMDVKGRFTQYYQEGLRFWKMHDRERAVYYLGGALYHLQDAWLGFSEDPQCESYVTEALGLQRDRVFPQATAARKANPEQWIEEATRERKRIGGREKKEGQREKTGARDHATLTLIRHAEVAGAGLLLQFFLEALE